MARYACAGCWWRVLRLHYHLTKAHQDGSTWRQRKVWVAEESLVAHGNSKHGRVP
jgi:alkylated DNA nucleotide flippase Atl1